MKTRGSQLAPRRRSGAAISRRWALALALLAGLVRPSATFAAEGSDAAIEADDQAARRHYAQGDAAYKAGRYDEALKEFEAGYAVSRRPGFLLNMAHTQRKLGHLREARALYKKYLLVDVNSKLRDEVRAVIGELDSALADEDLAERDRKGRGATGTGAAGDAAPVASAVSPPATTAVPKAPRSEADQPVLLQQGAGPAAAERGSGSPPFYRRGWFWVAVGAIALTGAGAAIYLSRRPGTDPFHDSGTLGSLGN
jgi:tetratricopeptide (TPR) repeat protein